MIERDNGRHTQPRAPRSNGANQAAITTTLVRDADDASLVARKTGEWQRANATRLQAAREAGAQSERHWLARELHDSVSPALYSIALLVSAARAGLRPDQETTHAALDTALSLTQKQLDEMRQLLAFMLAESLIEAISTTADFTSEYGGVEVTRDLCPEPALAVSVKVGLYKIAREAMHNAVKHAPGCRLLVRLQQRAGRVVLDIIDDGPGFTLSAIPTGHYGLVFMQERAASIDATIGITSSRAPARAFALWQRRTICHIIRLPQP